MIQVSIILNNNQIETLSYNYDGHEVSSKISDIIELKELDTSLLLYPKSLEADVQILEILQNENLTTPIRELSEITYNLKDLQALSITDLKSKVLNPIYTQFALQKNINLLDNLFEHISRLQDLIFNDRLSFFEELWHLIRVNSGAYDASLIYNGFVAKKIKKNTQNNDSSECNEHLSKGNLVQNMVIGNKYPQTKIKDELASTIFSEYKNQINTTFDILEFDATKGTFAMGGIINESSFMFVAKTFSISILQEKIIKTLINGINFKLNT